MHAPKKDARSREPELRGESARHFEHAFLSYSSRDREVTLSSRARLPRITTCSASRKTLCRSAPASPKVARRSQQLVAGSHQQTESSQDHNHLHLHRSSASNWAVRRRHGQYCISPRPIPDAANPNPNPNAVQMTAVFWIEVIEGVLHIHHCPVSTRRRSRYVKDSGWLIEDARGVGVENQTLFLIRASPTSCLLTRKMG